MSTFQEVRTKLQEERGQLKATDNAIYGMNQLVSLNMERMQSRINQKGILSPIEEEPEWKTVKDLVSKIEEYEKNNAQLREKITNTEKQLDALGSSQQIITQNWKVEIPTLLIPLRVHTRFVKIKHITKAKKEYVLDISQFNQVDLENQHQTLSETSANELLTKNSITNNAITKQLEQVLKKSTEKKWFVSKEDEYELWIRIYPDDIAIHSHETFLTSEEVEAGKIFWENYWKIQSTSEQEAEKRKKLVLAWKQLQRDHLPARAAWIYHQTMPKNFPSNNGFSGKPDFFKKAPNIKNADWTKPLKSYILPDHFEVSLYSSTSNSKPTKVEKGNRIVYPLSLSQNPLLDKDGVPAELSWLTDFDAAEKNGLGIRIPLFKSEYDQGFQKLVVLGLNLSLSAENAKESIEQLFINHQFKHGGMSILPQGTATNNFESETSGYSFKGPPADQVFAAIHDGIDYKKDIFWTEKTDTHYLAEALGIDGNILKNLVHAGAKDMVGAKAMNHLLWASTLGYYLEQFFQPIVSREGIKKTQIFFEQFVSGRGFIPAIQIGSQPYGILATTAYSELKKATSFLKNKSFEKKLFEQILSPLNEHWGKLLKHVKHLGDDIDIDRNSAEFHELLNFNASSEMFSQRPIIGQWMLRNLYRTHIDGNKMSILSWKKYIHSDLFQVAKADYIPDWLPAELNTLFNNLLKKSAGGQYKEARIFHQHIPYYGSSQKSLISSSDLEELFQISIDSIQKDYQNPKRHTLFYELAQKAIASLYLDLAIGFRLNSKTEYKKDRNIIDTIDFELEHLANSSGNTSLNKEHRAFLSNVNNKKPLHEIAKSYKTSKWDYLDAYLFTNNGDILMREYLQSSVESLLKVKPNVILKAKYRNLGRSPFKSLIEAKLSLKVLQEFSLKNLQDIFTEHIDLCSHRLDAWMQGVVNQRLFDLRKEENQPTGLYLGAYGYLENIIKGKEPGLIFKEEEVPNIRKYTPATSHHPKKVTIPILNFKAIKDENLNVDKILNHAWVYLGRDFNYTTEPHPVNPNKLIIAPIAASEDNQGFIQTPSELHAITAAILRSGYQANKTNEYYEAFAIDLSSARIRKALQIIQGVKMGQEFPAILGYQFERYLHKHESGPLDEYKLNFRQQFPQKVNPNYSENNSEEYLAAYSTVDGFGLSEYFRDLIKDGLTLNEKNQIQHKFNIKAQHLEQVIEVLNQLLLNIDAVSDLLLAESVYQVASGNLDAADTALKMMNNEAELVLPEIVKTPENRQLLDHLVGIHFDDRALATPWSTLESPKSTINPFLNNWLAKQIPSPNSICINVRLTQDRLKKLKLKDLKLQPIDFISLLDGKEVMSEASDFSKLIFEHLKSVGLVSSNDTIKITYKDRTGLTKSQLCIYEILPLIQSLNQLIAQARPLLPTDLLPDTRTGLPEDHSLPTLDNGRLIEAFTALKKFGSPYVFTKQLKDIEAIENNYLQWDALKKLANRIFGDTFLLCPEFELENQTEFELAKNVDLLSKLNNDFIVEEWFQGIAQVRKNLKNFQQIKQMRNLFDLKSSEQEFTIFQLPFKQEEYYWLGAEFPVNLDLHRDNLSIALELPDNYRTNKKLIGMIIDTWKEVLPEKMKTSAIAMNYNQPNMEPPQTLLFCVSPKLQGNWEWNELLQTVVDTMDLAKKRAVDYDIIAKGVGGQNDTSSRNPLQFILPGVVAPICDNGNTPEIDFSKS